MSERPMTNDTDYAPTTANEAGDVDLTGIHAPVVMPRSQFNADGSALSKPCTDDEVGRALDDETRMNDADEALARDLAHVKDRELAELVGDGPVVGTNVQRVKIEDGKITAVKPCTEGGDHCFCARVDTANSFYGDYRENVGREKCCWCPEHRTYNLVRQRVPGHGPYRTELVRE